MIFQTGAATISAIRYLFQSAFSIMVMLYRNTWLDTTLKELLIALLSGRPSMSGSDKAIEEEEEEEEVLFTTSYQIVASLRVPDKGDSWFLIILLLLGMFSGIQSSKRPPTETSISPCVISEDHGTVWYKCNFTEGNSTDFFKVKGSIAKLMKETTRNALEIESMQLSRLSNNILAGITLTNFVLTQSDISEIDKDAFKDSVNSLTALALTYTNLTKIPIEAISTLRKLNILWISFSSFSSIAKSDMDKLPTFIRLLGLQHNKISTIDQNAFDKLVNLKELWLDSNMLTSFSNTMPPKLVFIHLGVYSIKKKAKYLAVTEEKKRNADLRNGYLGQMTFVSEKMLLIIMQAIQKKVNDCDKTGAS
ncbi:Leucine-rich repeat-containing G-protein coupled receptor 4 [Nymphon striatum]|nr:Leucine-rich repeat-containing G-protein coupled receptor 4 [Nymphon striatum]